MAIDKSHTTAHALRSEDSAARLNGNNMESNSTTSEVRDPLPLRNPSAGVFIALIGLLLRCFARWLAWPSDWDYKGDRANTIWAYRESLYSDLGLVALLFGLAWVLLDIARAPASKRASSP